MACRVLWSHPLCSTVLMLKPKVGEMVEISSPRNFLTIVVFPALSRPLHRHTVKERDTLCSYCGGVVRIGYSIRILQSFSFCFIFFRIDRSPIFTELVY